MAMPHLDAPQRYDLADASEALHCDPKRLIRQARSRQIPALWQDGAWVFPAAWVDAASGRAPTDESSIRTYWLERLSPPSSKARRATRDTSKLTGHVDVDRLLRKEAVRQRLYVDAAALERLTKTGLLPTLRVNGDRHYDAELVDLLARRAAGETIPRGLIDERVAKLRELARFEYRDGAGIPTPTYSVPDQPKPMPAASATSPTTTDTPATTSPNPNSDVPVTHSPVSNPTDPDAPDANPPGAYQIPDDLGPLIEADGFDVLDD